MRPSPTYVPVRASGGPGAFDTLTVTGQASAGSLAVTGDADIGGIITSQDRVVDADMHPADHGFETWTHDPAYPASSVTVVNGRVYVVKLPVRRAFSVVRAWWAISTPGVGPVAGQSFIGLYDMAGTLLASASIDGQVTGSGGQSTALSAAVGTGYVRVAFLFNAATPPGLVRGSSFETTPNINLSPAAYRAAVVASGQTALPPSFDPATLTTSNCLTLFAALESA